MIYVTGDTHGEADRLSPSKLRALKAGDTLIVCGDFGFLWDDSKTISASSTARMRIFPF